MLRALLRLFFALGGAALAAILIALVEARAVLTAVVEGAAQESAPFGALFAADLGLLAPVVLGVGVGVGVAVVLLVGDGEGGASLRQRMSRVMDASGLDRMARAAVAPLLIFAVFAWCVVSAHLAKGAMGAGLPAEAGLTVGIGSVAAFVAMATLSFACLPFVRRGLAAGSETVPQLVDPAFTASVATIIVGLLFALGIVLGDTSGVGGGALGVFGVLKRPELDLRSVAYAAVLAVAALFAIAIASASATPRRIIAGAGGIMFVVLFALFARASSHLGDTPSVAHGLEKSAPLGKLALSLARRLTDHDKDGFSARFAGGDCNDNDKQVNPNALDIPGNGVDEDCSGEDTPEIVTADTKPSDKKTVKPTRSFNVILLTVDTLRPDLGFMNYGKPTSPNLDKVAAKATVFERAYSMASYTGKAVGPMLIGKYPSETNTDFSHFNTYFDSNVFLAERLHDAGIRTFAGMCHWYFRNPTGLKQGFDVWDTSAIPPGMGDNDNVITSDRMGDLALKLLQAPENTSPARETNDREQARRFFAWFHFFDPHAQYVPHPGVPDVSSTGPFGQARTLYDGEVWYTDKHIGRVLDYIASQPWAEDTAIVMTADHGEAFFEHGMSWHGSELWEELVHVPLFVYVPGAEPRRVPSRRSHIDLVPTILELMGVPLPDDGSLRGTSLLEDVYLPSGAEHEERDTYIDMPQGPFNGVRRAVISGTSPGMKLIHSGGYNYQLFDLDTDPDEKKDLSKDKALRDEAIAKMNSVRGRLKEVEVKPPK